MSETHGGSLRVLGGSPADRQEWERLLASWPGRDVFADPAYLDLYARAGERAACVVYTAGAATVLQPVVLRSVDVLPFWSGEARDDVAPPPFGYAGPFVWGEADDEAREVLLRDYYAAYAAWAREAGVVAEYTLFSPMAPVPACYPGETVERIPVVVRDLTPTEDEIWADYRSQVRRNVRAAVRRDVRVTVDEDGKYADAFLAVHEETMDRRDGLAHHRVDAGLLDRLHRALPGRFAYLHAWCDGQVVSSDLLLVSAGSTYYFRGGTRAEFLDTRANQLLKHECVLWSRRTGRHAFLLGGGVDGHDSLLRYKAGFAPGGVRTLWAGRWCLDPERYAELVAARRAYGAPGGGDGDAESSGFFPAYRA